MTVSLEPGTLCVVCHEDKRELFFATAAAAEGIAPSTMHGWLERHPEVRALLAGAVAGAITTNLQQVNQAADKGDWSAAAWLLERSCPEGFGRRVGLDMVKGVAITADLHAADARVK